MCPLRFSNELPDAAGEPRMLDYPFDPLRFVKYTPTSLEKNLKHTLLTEADLGIPIDLIDPNAYLCSAEQKEAGLDERDLALLEEKEDQSRRDHLPQVSWLRKTEYMTMDYQQEPLYNRAASRTVRAKTLEDFKALVDESLTPVEEIEETFKEAQEAPVHATKPHLTAVEVLPLLPNSDLWPFSFKQVAFDQDPAPRRLAGKTEEETRELQKQQEELCAAGVVNALQTADGEDYAIFLVPKLDDIIAVDVEAFQEQDDEEKHYDFVREYHFHIASQADTNRAEYVVSVQDGRFTYNELDARVELRRRARVPNSQKAPSFADAVPGTIRLQSVRLTEADKQAMEQRSSALRRLQVYDELDEEMADIMAGGGGDEGAKDSAAADIFGSDGDDDDDDLSDDALDAQVEEALA